MILSASPALAEITPKSVWDNLNAYYDRYGLTVQTGAVEEAGDVLTVRDLVLSQKAEGSQTVIDMGNLILSATGDGAVKMNIADVATGIMTFDKVSEGEVEAATDDAVEADVEAEAATDDAATDTAPDTDAAPDAAAEPEDSAEAEDDYDDHQPPRQVNFEMRFTSDDITVSEDGDAVLYAYLIPRTDFVVTEIEMQDGLTVSQPLRMTIENLEGHDRVDSTDASGLVQALNATSIAIDFKIDDEDAQGTGNFLLTGMTADSKVSSTAGFGADVDMAKMLQDGFSLASDIAFSKISGAIDMQTVDDEGQRQPVRINMDSRDIKIGVGMDKTRLSYAVSSGPGSADFTVPDVPVPVGYELAAASLKVELPVSAGSDPQPFSFHYLLDQVVLKDQVWAIFDPNMALPRDPAQLDIDVSGNVVMERDLFDSEHMHRAEALDDPDLTDEQREAIIDEMSPPFTMADLSLNNVALALMGASAQFQGKLTTPDGDASEPVGTITGRFQGIQALTQKLQASGLIPAEQAAMLPMMLGMFAKPDPQAADTMTTEIEFREGGQVFANGQQVR
ncbi:hypothetical protein CYR75_12670 [Paracoccus jeotgali]|uniref:DUF2125 domain-containing protein n=2 Tax=Paracoccus jeotgali TaxID=2065379 RepID=A0A2K9MH99_9RHOB|nr:hypothetical protein CYR75_12670 [Paracoccus jeotgali]